MDEDQCQRPSKRWNMRPPTRDKRERGKRITGWLAGHTIHLEIKKVTWIKKKIELIDCLCNFELFSQTVYFHLQSINCQSLEVIWRRDGQYIIYNLYSIRIKANASGGQGQVALRYHTCGWIDETQVQSSLGWIFWVDFFCLQTPLHHSTLYMIKFS